MITEILYFGKTVYLSCDAKCNKAWGINSRPKVQLSDDEDDYVYVADSLLEEAPSDPGTYEGGHAKPTNKIHNKWCARECERSTKTNHSNPVIRDMENPQPNIKKL